MVVQKLQRCELHIRKKGRTRQIQVKWLSGETASGEPARAAIPTMPGACLRCRDASTGGPSRTAEARMRSAPPSTFAHSSHVAVSARGARGACAGSTE